MISKTAYRVEMSTDGVHKVVVTIDDHDGTYAALAWAQATYHKLTRGEATEHASSQLGPPQCPYHGQPMVRVSGRLGPFWSCNEKNSDGSWCSYRPPQG